MCAIVSVMSQLLAKERKDVPSKKTEFERRTVTVPRGQRGTWNTPQRSNFRSQPTEGQRGRSMWRPRSYRPIEARRCYECGKPGHLSYNYPNLQVQGKFANVAKDNQTRAIWENFLKENMKRMSMKCRLSWQEDKGNDRKGRKHERRGEEERRKSPQRKPPPQYDRL